MTQNLVLGVKSTMGDDSQLALRNIITRAALVQPNVEIVTKIEGGYHRKTYKSVEPMAQKLASSISSLGIKAGDRIGSFMLNNYRHLVLYYTIASMGVVLNTLNRSLHPNRLQYIINHAQNKIIFVDAFLLPLFEKINLNKCPSVQKIIVCGPNEKSGNWKTNIPNCIDFEDFLYSYGTNHFKWPNLDERNGLILCYTSGTTGPPKGVLYSHRSAYLRCLTFMMNDFQSLSGTDCALSLPPFYHAAGWFTPFGCFVLGYKLCLQNQYSNPNILVDIIKDEKVTLFYGVPTLLQNIKTIIQNNKSKYYNIKNHLDRVVSGGSSCPPNLINWYMKELNVEIIQAYGMTELLGGCVGRRCITRRDYKMQKEGGNDDILVKNQIYQGVRNPTTNIKIVDKDNHSIEKEWDGKLSSTGEIIVKGPTTTKSYYGIDAKDRFTSDGYLITGDVGYFNKYGQLILKDRSKDLIKSGGEWISSVDLENYICNLKGVSRACVVGVKHPKWIQRPVVIVELNKNITKNITLNDIKNHCKKEFTQWQCPDDILFFKIPLTGTGKLDKKAVRLKLKNINYILPDLRNKKSKL